MTGDLFSGPESAAREKDASSFEVSITDEERFLNREASWCDFADRLLELVGDCSSPLLQRVRFASIWAEGMDEFFQVRMAGLKDQVAVGVRTRSPDGKTASQQLKLVRKRCVAGWRQMDEAFSGLVDELAAEGVHLLHWSDLDNDERAHCLKVFDSELFPVLTPLAVDQGHPFPYISNLSLNLGVLVGDDASGEHRFARVKIPSLFPRLFQLGEEARFIAIEEVIAENLDRLFPEMTLGGHYAFRVTRSIDLALADGEADDLLAAVEVELRRRRFGRAVRLEVGSDMPEEVRDLLRAELELEPDDVYEASVPIDLRELTQLYELERPDLTAEPWVPMTPPRLATAADEPVDLFAAIRERDVLVHHPYDSFASSVEAFVNQAADDPKVLAIKQTLYRTSPDTEIVDALARAAEKGKQVAALVELQARFDEKENISRARQLERAGVHVVYGLVGLKTHSKIALVIRREEDGVRAYCHVGTGNYNSLTAREYEDIGLLSADRDLCADLTELFNYLTGYGRQARHRRIVTAPHELRGWIKERLAAEAAHGREGRVTIKVNGLTDPEVIDALYATSCAGARVELVVRGLCSLRPGVPGLSDNVTVRSIVGRFLEHSRIYRFGEPDSERGAEHFIGSPDLMERNLDRRVEALAPVLDAELKRRLDETLALNLADDVDCWQLGPEGSWERCSGGETSTQERLQQMAVERARRRRASDAPY